MLVADLKSFLEETFSMPFVVRTEQVNGFEGFVSYPANENQEYFEVRTYIQNKVRVVVEIMPQKYAVPMLMTMGSALQEKRSMFKLFFENLQERNVKITFEVNGVEIKSALDCAWNEPWRSMRCRLTKVPITETNESYDEKDVICEWTKQGFCLFFSLLTISDTESVVEGRKEGSLYQVVCNKYERNPLNRELCLLKKGYSCSICDFNFEQKYGEIGKNFINVHHIVPVSQLGPDYLINPELDLIPVCPNCHAMLHRKNPPYLPGELKRIIKEEFVC